MQPITGKPEVMKQMNAALIYRALISLRSATRAEISEKTRLSVTTVRSLLEELTRENAVIALALDESSGGRRAQRYCLSQKRNLILALYFDNGRIRFRVSDLLGNELESGEHPVLADNAVASVYALFDARVERGAIGAIGLGVPGVVENGSYYLSGTQGDRVMNHIGEQLEQALRMPVLLENDLNAVAVGFALRRTQNLPAGDASGLDMVYVHFNKGCSGAGIIADGHVVRGVKRFAGELGFLPMGNGETLDQALTAADPADRLDVMCRAIAMINCVTNPALVVLGGERVVADHLEETVVSDCLKAYIPDPLRPAIAICTDCDTDYLAGLAHLTTEALLPTLP